MPASVNRRLYSLPPYLIPFIAEKGSIFIFLIKMEVLYMNEGRDTWKALRVRVIMA